MASRKITIKRRKNYTKLPEDVYALSKRNVGACFSSSGAILSGLTLEEEDKLLPRILGISKSSPEFYAKKHDFYASLTINIPINGCEFEIGTNDKGEILDPISYVKYMVCYGHPWVALSEDEIKPNSVIKFYIVDDKKELKKKHDKFLIKKNANKELIKLSGDSDKMDLVLRQYGVDPKSFSKEDKDLFLDDKVSVNPAQFISIVEDKNLEMRAFILECLSKEVLYKEGNTVLDGDSPLGTIEETIHKLKDKGNSDILIKLKARLKNL